MATSGSKTVNVAAAAGSYTDGVRLKLSWAERSQSVANNTTTVRFTLQIITGKYGQMIGSAQQTWKISCAGKSKSGHFTINQSDNTTRTLATWDVTISHKSDGTGSFTASFSASFNMDFNGWVGTKSGSLSGTLDRIARASTPSVSGTLQLGSAITIKTNRASSSFTHKITWSWAGQTGTIAIDAGASVVWTPSLATMAPFLTDATSAKCTLTCVTYSGSTNIGSKTTSFTLSIPSSVVPSISDVEVTDANGLNSRFGAFVKLMSDLRVAIMAAGMYGSTIASYSASMDGVSASGSPAVLGNPSTAGTRTVTATVKDSRGRTASATTQITVADYEAPALSGCEAYRYDTSTGEESDESTTIIAKLNATYWNINGYGTNSLETHVYYRRVGDSDWIEAGEWHDSPFGGAGAVSASHQAQVNKLPESNRYEFRFTAEDSVGGTAEAIVGVGTAQPVIDLKGDGEGMAFFAIADQQGVKVGKPLYIAKGAGSFMEADDGTWLEVMSVTELGRMLLKNHPALANASYLLGQLAGGNFTRLLGINESDQVEMTWTSGGLKGRVMKQIWSGSVTTGGKATISELPYYNLFVFFSSANAAPIFVARGHGTDSDSYFGAGGYGINSTSNVGRFMGVQCSSSGSPTVLSVTRAQMCATNASSGEEITISNIYGVM